ncbi:MAG: AraC family transcriptional regulator [Spirochaetaceae bacterium]
MNSFYINKVNLAIDYIEENFDTRITTKELAEVSAFSEYHFHRIFKSITNETVNQYIGRLRMGKTYRNLIISNDPITSIAFNYGYSSSANFTRDFRKYYNTSPSFIRKSRSSIISKISNPNNLSLKFLGLKDIPDMEVIYRRVSDGYNTTNIQASFKELLNFIKINKVKFADVRSIGIGYDDPDYISHKKCRYDACISFKKDLNLDTNNFNKKTLSPNKCAVYLFEGYSKDFVIAWDFIIKTWITNKRYRPGDSPHFEEYLPTITLKKDYFKARLNLPIVKL